MQYPYQCLTSFGDTKGTYSSNDAINPPRRNILLAASGPQILSINTQNGQKVSVWPVAEIKDAIGDQNEVSEEGKKSDLATQPKIINLVAVGDGEHLIAVTGDDKCIRVFDVDAEGRLSQISKRCMPKRPCAVTLTPDCKTIICGDKFGDVYALPLEYAEQISADPTSEKNEDSKKAFVPSASEKTVHSLRNRKALEDQRKQKPTEKAKEALKFEHQLLLGHVSLLTDLHLVAIEDQNTGHARSYLLTSDRDEHIRVSRGPPQAHIIENYCLGHEEFVSKLLLVTPEVLISGGGDDYLMAWDWKAGRRQAQIDLRETVAEAGLGGDIDIAVSGLWSMYDKPRLRHLVLIALEGVPILLTFIMNIAHGIVTVSGRAVTSLPGNLLDLVVSDKSIVVSTDSLKQDQETTLTHRLHAYTLSPDFVTIGKTSRNLGEMWQPDPSITAALTEANGHTSLETSRQSIDELVYSIRSLRKRGGYGEDTQL